MTRAVPRAGVSVYLPGLPEDDGGLYQVLDVRYSFANDPEAKLPTGARMEEITVSVRRLSSVGLWKSGYESVAPS